MCACLSDGLSSSPWQASFPRAVQNLRDWMKNCKLFLNCFSVLKNGKSVLSTSFDENHITCFDGIRVLALLVVILSHIVGFYPNILRNADEKFLEFLKWNVAPKGILVLDAYFIMSGGLIGYSVSSHHHTKGRKISLLSALLRRFIKLTSSQMIVVGFYATLFSYIGSGPVWPKYDTNPLCKENWIWNFLYLNNFLSPDQMCITHNWYLGCLMQLHLTSSLFLTLLTRNRKMGYALTVFASLFSFLTSYLLIIKNNIVESLLLILNDIPDMKKVADNIWTYFDMVHTKPYTRLGSYAAGIALGFYIRKHKLSSYKKFSLAKLSFGWLISGVLLWICITGVINPEGPSYEIAAFHSIKPLVYSCYFSWVTFACVTGHGGLLNKFLSCNVFKVLSRLTYTGYLLHPMVLEKYFFSFDKFIDHSDLNFVLIYTYLVLWTFAISFIFSLIFEKPVAGVLDFFQKNYDQKNLHQKTN
ncbi:unnamed protein product [Larinioides sclopetarius]|uniref:Acyltransferase 3 domain-containing protein n=1 Tax=Larinioides sclopetarius TaxID=280406 RepID=A0AAV2BWG1_9ARAC